MTSIQNLPLGQTGGVAAGGESTATFDLNGTGAAPAADVARFDQRMGVESQSASMQPVAPADGSLPTMGARILASFTSMSNQYEEVSKRSLKLLDEEGMSGRNLMRSLGDMLEMHQGTNLVSKVMGKATQTVTDLTK